MSEKWEIDQSWCVTNGKIFFYVGDIVSISNEHPEEIILILNLTKITIQFAEGNSDKDEIYKWFCMIKSKYHDDIISHTKKQQTLAQASVEIQNRMAGHIVHEH